MKLEVCFLLAGVRGISALSLSSTYRRVSGVELSAKVQGLQDEVVSDFQHQWEEEEAHLKAYEKAVMDDPDLENIVEHVGMTNKQYMDQEAHKHDSFLAEVEHAIENDPYLDGVVHEDHHTSAAGVNSGHMEREAHKHDSLWNEIESSIANDPDLL